MSSRYPIYIISKGRWESRLTSKTLETMGIDYKIVVEKQEYYSYASVIDKKKILILDETYKEKYDAFTTDKALGKGSGPARNFCWEHALSKGHERHWLLDDNIDGFFLKNKDTRYRVKNKNYFRPMEDFVDRYSNIALAGPNYKMFVPRKWRRPVFTVNTRVFSCILINNNLPIRWRCRYNEDVDLSIRALKDGWCNLLFNNFLQGKMTTQTMKGGNTDLLYKKGTVAKSEMLKRAHPDVVELCIRYGRPHHKVDFSQWKNRPLKKKEGIKINEGINNYGMTLKKNNKE